MSFDASNCRDQTAYTVATAGNYVTQQVVVNEQEFVEGKYYFRVQGRCMFCGKEGKMYMNNKMSVWYDGVGSGGSAWVGTDIVCKGCLRDYLICEEMME